MALLSFFFLQHQVTLQIPLLMTFFKRDAYEWKVLSNRVCLQSTKKLMECSSPHAVFVYRR